MPPGSSPWSTGTSAQRTEVSSSPEPGSSSRRQVLLVALASAVVGALVAAGVALAFIANDDPDIVARPPLATPAGAMDIDAILAEVRESVVTVETNAEVPGLFPGAGSGIILSEDGLVLTNHHVISQSTEITVRLSDGEEHTATLVGSSPDNDLAVIRIVDVDDLVPAELGDSEVLKVGEPVIAIGNALNLGDQPTVTQGIVSALDRSISGQGPRGEVVTLDNLIQTDAAINRGNSGGPLVDSSGQVVGVNTAIIADSQNIGFAIAIDPVRSLIDDLRSGQGEITGDMAFLGVSTISVEGVSPADRDRFNITVESGTMVDSVVPDSAADEAGLQLGDVVVAFDGEAIETAADLRETVQEHEAGEEVEIVIQRQGEEQTLTAALGGIAG